MTPEEYLGELCDLVPFVDVVPTEDPRWWVMTGLCDADCHHPVHGFDVGRRAHLVEVPPFETRVFGEVVG